MNAHLRTSRSLTPRGETIGAYHRNLRHNEHALFLVFLGYPDGPKSPTRPNWHHLQPLLWRCSYLYWIGKWICKLLWIIGQFNQSRCDGTVNCKTVFSHGIDKDRLDSSLVEQNLKRITGRWSSNVRRASGALEREQISIVCALDEQSSYCENTVTVRVIERLI